MRTPVTSSQNTYILKDSITVILGEPLTEASEKEIKPILML